MRTTVILSGVAGLFLLSSPAWAQEAAPQTPPAAPPTTQQAPTMSLQPGMTVRGSDGTELGKLEGARQTATGQELTVRGADGQLRGVPTNGLRQENDGVVAGWSASEFQAAPVIAAAPATPAPTTPAPTTPAPATGAPAADPQPSDPANPPPVEQPDTPDEAPETSPPTPPGT